jgi:hypothetical protein
MAIEQCRERVALGRRREASLCFAVSTVGWPRREVEVADDSDACGAFESFVKLSALLDSPRPGVRLKMH